MPHSQPTRRKTDSEDSNAHMHRRATDRDAVAFLHRRVDDHDATINKILESQRDMADNLKTLTNNLGRVAEVLEAWNNAKGFWLTVKFMSAVMRVLVPLGAFGLALWVLLKTGIWPDQK